MATQSLLTSPLQHSGVPAAIVPPSPIQFVVGVGADVVVAVGYMAASLLGFKVMFLLVTTVTPMTVAIKRKVTPRRLDRPTKPFRESILPLFGIYFYYGKTTFIFNMI